MQFNQVTTTTCVRSFVICCIPLHRLNNNHNLLFYMVLSFSSDMLIKLWRLLQKRLFICDKEAKPEEKAYTRAYLAQSSVTISFHNICNGQRQRARQIKDYLQLIKWKSLCLFYYIQQLVRTKYFDWTRSVMQHWTL